MLHPAVPLLRIFDPAIARRHYVDFLGFQVDWEHRFEPDLPVYLQIHRDALILHLTEHHGDCTPGARIRVRVDDLRGLHSEVRDQHYPYARPGVEETPWGDLEMTIADPFGNRITFYEPDLPPIS